MSSPVLTFLSRSPAASKKTLTLLAQLGAMEPVFLDRSTSQTNVCWHDELDKLFPSSLLQWNSSASKCRHTGTILHLISIQNSNVNNNIHNIDDDEQPQNLSLLSITPSSVSKDVNESLSLARHTLAIHIKDHYDSYSFPLLQYWKTAFQLTAWKKLGKSTSTQHIFGRQHNGLPILKLKNDPSMLSKNNYEIVENKKTDSCEIVTNDSYCIREIVLPHRDDARYIQNGSSLLQELSMHMHQPKTGLFQWNSGIDQAQNQIHSNERNYCAKNKIFFRPLPASQQDMVLSSPTVVFSSPTLHEIMDQTDKNYSNENSGKQKDDSILLDPVRFEKIGFNGNRKGQLLARHKSLIGLDIRFCESKVLSSTFAESQESLMAGSLDELQSAHVMLEGKTNKENNTTDMHQDTVCGKHNAEQKNAASEVRPDAMNGIGDCWIEFRASMKHPTLFLRKLYDNSVDDESITQKFRSNKSTLKRIAKAPNLPFQ